MRRLLLATGTGTVLLGWALLAQAQDVGLGRAGEEFFAQCDVLGDCSGDICGQPFVYTGTFGGGVITLTDLNITATVSSTDDPNAIRVARILNAYCGSSRGDGLLVSGGSIATQAQQFERFGRAMVKQPPAAYQAGGVGELGTDTWGASIPLSYAKRLSPSTFMNGSGTLSFAHRELLNQVAFAGAPSFGMRVGDLARNAPRLAAGAFVPLSFAMSSVEGVDRAPIAWGAGVGGIFVATTESKGTELSGGITGLVRYTNAGIAVPISLFTRAQRPVTPLLDGFASIGYTNDFTGEASNFAMLGAGVAAGSWEFGYKGFFLNDAYTAHTLGFSFREEPQGAQAIAEPIPEPRTEPSPAPPTTEDAGQGTAASQQPGVLPSATDAGPEGGQDGGVLVEDAGTMDAGAGEAGEVPDGGANASEAGLEEAGAPAADANSE